MKTTLLKLKYFLIAGIAIAMLSCNPEDGADGMDGAPGIQGEQGQDGNANVVSVRFSDVLIEEGINTFSIPEITQEIFDNGLIIGYVKVATTDFWEPLPIALNNNERIALEIDKIRVGSLDIKSTFSQMLDFRFILVPSSTSSTGKNSKQSTLNELKKARIDITNFYEVADYYRLDY